MAFKVVQFPTPAARLFRRRRSILLTLKKLMIGRLGRPCLFRGQLRQFDDVQVTSALPPIAAVKLTLRHFAFVPRAEVVFEHSRWRVMDLGGVRERACPA